MADLRKKDQFFCMNIRDCLVSDPEQIIGENELIKILSDFSSPKNKDIEFFLKERAIEFAKKNQSVTYLVFAHDTLDFVGYFSITVRPVIVNSNGLSKSTKKKLDRVGKCDEETGDYTVAAYLIAQFGRNYSESVTHPITGVELMDYAIEMLSEIQYALGGMMVYLECEEIEALLEFYEKKNGFRIFGERFTENQQDPHKLIQLMNFL